MKNPALQTAALLTSALFLCSCAPRRVPFNEADFARAGHFGSGTIGGTAFRTLADDSVEDQNSNTVLKLMPANAYTQEEVERRYANRHWLVAADSRMARYVREIHPDDDGHFAFRHVAPGDYYVAFKSIWSYPSTSTDADGNIMATEAEDDQWIYARVSVKNGQTVKIDSWAQGK